MDGLELQASWDQAWSALGASPRPGLFEQVVARYGESHRHYHTLQHLQECLEYLRAVPGPLERPGEVALALWFHDAVYELDRHDNEWQSAQWLERETASAGLAPDARRRLVALVMCTQHSAAPTAADACWLVDIDLSILGASRPRFDAYERQIRQEYRGVPEPEFQRRRLSLLNELLGRPRLYRTPYFQGLLEARARQNLKASVAALTPPAVPGRASGGPANLP